MNKKWAMFTRDNGSQFTIRCEAIVAISGDEKGSQIFTTAGLFKVNETPQEVEDKLEEKK